MAADPSRLSKRARECLERDRTGLFVSAISAFEIALKHRKRRLRLDLDPEEWFSRALRFHGLEESPIDSAIAIRSALLPALHSDPCDRIIVATAARNGLEVLTPDERIAAYPQVTTIW